MDAASFLFQEILIMIKQFLNMRNTEIHDQSPVVL